MSPLVARFCAVCGQPLVRRVPSGDNRERDLCEHCGAVHYVNPRPVVGTIPVWQDTVLLCKRAIEPRLGKWTLPAGFMEVGETTREGALRETLEEARARVELGPLFTMIDVPYIEQVHVNCSTSTSHRARSRVRCACFAKSKSLGRSWLFARWRRRCACSSLTVRAANSAPMFMPSKRRPRGTGGRGHDPVAGA